MNEKVIQTLKLLDLHYQSFHGVEAYSRKTKHPVPVDTRGWSQVIVSVLTGIDGLSRKKGPDLEDGSDVKGANTWNAIDTPRFNNVIKAGTKSSVSGKVQYLDTVPYLFLALWDTNSNVIPRFRIWCVRPQHDQLFRNMCKKWYLARTKGDIKSENFQLHPPRGLDSNEIRNSYGNFFYPLFFCAELRDLQYELIEYDHSVLSKRQCILNTASVSQN